MRNIVQKRALKLIEVDHVHVLLRLRTGIHEFSYTTQLINTPPPPPPPPLIIQVVYCVRLFRVHVWILGILVHDYDQYLLRIMKYSSNELLNVWSQGYD